MAHPRLLETTRPSMWLAKKTSKRWHRKLLGKRTRKYRHHLLLLQTIWNLYNRQHRYFKLLEKQVLRYKECRWTKIFVLQLLSANQESQERKDRRTEKNRWNEKQKVETEERRGAPRFFAVVKDGPSVDPRTPRKRKTRHSNNPPVEHHVGWIMDVREHRPRTYSTGYVIWSHFPISQLYQLIFVIFNIYHCFT